MGIACSGLWQKVLVVEDDVWMKPIIMSALKSAIPGVMVDWVESAEEAIRKTEKSQYSLIVADINLKPDHRTGLDLWAECKRDFPEIPVLLISSIPIDHLMNRMAYDLPYYLNKPFNISQCKEVFRNLTTYVGPAS